MPATGLYPPIEPYQSGHLKVSDLHSLYWEMCGNPDGVPVVFLHGGPGGGISPNHRRFFDPGFYRTLLFDQRGSGRSRPFGETRENTTPFLIADIERLREMIGVDSWIVFGGSWGSTLALAYAQAHPERVRALALRGIFLCRKEEIDWFLYGMKWFMPEASREFTNFLPPEERGDLLTHYHRRLMDPDPAIHMPAARKWSVYEGTCATLLPSPETVAGFETDQVALALARMEAHYFVNDIFLPENALLKNIDRIRHIPTVIVQGRYDLVCPIKSADDLVQAWPEAKLVVVPDAGHSAMEPGTSARLVEAMEGFKGL